MNAQRILDSCDDLFDRELLADKLITQNINEKEEE